MIDFIKTYPDVIDDYTIDALIEMADSSAIKNRGPKKENDGHRKDKQTVLQIGQTFNQGLSSYVNQCLLKNIFSTLCRRIPYQYMRSGHLL